MKNRFAVRVAYDEYLDQYLVKRGDRVVFVGSQEECERFFKVHVTSRKSSQPFS
ncbi:hypothetical protein [Marinoscillum sp.]|uniref:hypothetical protein n=1 Tax=Marinoscillum sp. TaxID=2024838 RepID=UPI003BAA6ACA